MWHTKEIEEIEKNFRTNRIYGIETEEAKKRIEHFGENKLANKKKENIFIKFIKQFNDFMIIILIIASIVSAIITKMNGENDYIDSIIIIAIVVFNAIMGLIQEAKAEKSLEALKNMTAPVAKVRRNGKIETISANEVVPGDIILLEAGNYVPADARLISCSNLKVEESSLTGETLPVLKDANVILNKEQTLGDMVNMVFSSTIVVNGHGEAIVTETGMNTKVGKIAGMIITNEAPQTPIQKKLAGVGKSLGIGCLVICLFIFIIGIFKKIPAMEMFMTSVGLAVAAIPEGLPAVVTIMLSIGVTKMARKNAIIRKLPAVETLGSSSVICSDKTGTLTQNKMQVVEHYTLGAGKRELKTFACMCTDTQISYENSKKKAVGEPTEVALVEDALKDNIDKFEMYKINKRVADIPFESSRKMMSTIHKNNNSYMVITKGAPDIILGKCLYYKKENTIVPMDSSVRRNIEEANNKMAEKALRVIAICYKKIERVPTNMESKEIENNLIFVGLIGMIDPPREGVKEAVTTCRRAGIKTVMITGDHITTAKAIAKELGILKMRDKAITGAELDKIGQKELERDIMNYSVFARVSPEHKVRIVKAFQSTGAVVAMTGDGVNDAPALKGADIGVGMGITGTEVSKSVSSMILADDNFATIVVAIKEGRRIYANIQNVIVYLLASNLAEVLIIFLATLFNRTILLPIHLLWINLVTDTIPAIALGFEKEEKNIMRQKPRSASEKFFTPFLTLRILIPGIIKTIVMFLIYFFVEASYGAQMASAAVFTSLSIIEVLFAYVCRSDKRPVFKIGLFSNMVMVLCVICTLILQVLVISNPVTASWLKIPLMPNHVYIMIIVASIDCVVIFEFVKVILAKMFHKVK